MKQWAVIVLGVLALSIGASAPTLIIETLRLGSIAPLNRPSPSNRDADSKHQSNATDKHQETQTGQQPSVTRPPAEQTQDQHPVASKPRHESYWNTPEGWTAGFTGALFIATAGLWLFTALLWRTTRRAVTEGQDAVKAAQATAEAAGRQAEYMRGTRGIMQTQADILQKQLTANRAMQRAHIAVEPGGVRPFSAVDERIACDIIIVNAGNVAATHLSWFIDYKYSAKHNETVFRISRDLVGDIVIAPTGRATKGSRPTTKTEFQKFSDKYSAKSSVYLYIYGRISYDDGFNKRRFIDYCHRYNLRGAASYHIDIMKARYHEHGNATGEVP